MKRKRAGTPNLSTQVACLLLEVLDRRGQGIAYQDAKRMTVKEICALVRWDHVVHDVWGGTLHPTNLVPRLVAESRKRAATKDIPEIAKAKRIQHKRAAQPLTRATELMMRVDVRGDKADGPRRQPIPGSKASPWKRKLNGKTERRPC